MNDSMVTVLDALDARPDATALRELGYRRLVPGEGETVVDVGCGAGRAVAELGRLGVRAVGIDPDPDMLALARERWPDGEFRAGEAYDLPLADGEVAGYRADKVFHELADPAAALAEARRVLAPGGRIVLVGQDWDAVVVDSADPATTRALVHATADRIRNPRAARSHRGALLDAGFADVRAEVHTLLFTDPMALALMRQLAGASPSGVEPDALARWLADQERRAATDRLFLAVPFFLASARKPD